MVGYREFYYKFRFTINFYAYYLYWVLKLPSHQYLRDIQDCHIDLRDQVDNVSVDCSNYTHIIMWTKIMNLKGTGWNRDNSKL